MNRPKHIRKITGAFSNIRRQARKGNTELVLQRLDELQKLVYESLDHHKFEDIFAEKRFLEVKLKCSKNLLTFSPKTGRITLKCNKDGYEDIDIIRAMAEVLLKYDTLTNLTFRGEFRKIDGKWSCNLRTKNKKYLIEL